MKSVGLALFLLCSTWIASAAEKIHEAYVLSGSTSDSFLVVRSAEGASPRFFWGTWEKEDGKYKGTLFLRPLCPVGDEREVFSTGRLDFRSLVFLNPPSSTHLKTRRGTLALQPFQRVSGESTGLGRLYFGSSKQGAPKSLEAMGQKYLHQDLGALPEAAVASLNAQVDAGLIRFETSVASFHDFEWMAQGPEELRFAFSRELPSQRFHLWLISQSQGVEQISLNEQNSLSVSYPYGSDLIVRVGPKNYVAIFNPALDAERLHFRLTFYQRTSPESDLKRVHREIRQVEPGNEGVDPAKLEPRVQLRGGRVIQLKRLSTHTPLPRQGEVLEFAPQHAVLGVLEKWGMSSSVLYPQNLASPFDLLKPQIYQNTSEWIEWAYESSSGVLFKFRRSAILDLLRKLEGKRKDADAHRAPMFRLFRERLRDLLVQPVFWMWKDMNWKPLIQLLEWGGSSESSILGFQESISFRLLDGRNEESLMSFKHDGRSADLSLGDQRESLTPLQAEDVAALEAHVLSKDAHVFPLPIEYREVVRSLKDATGRLWVIDRAALMPASFEHYRVFSISSSGAVQMHEIKNYTMWPDGGSTLLELSDGSQLYFPTETLKNGLRAVPQPSLNDGPRSKWLKPFFRASSDDRPAFLKRVKLQTHKLNEVRRKFESLAGMAFDYQPPQVQLGPYPPHWPRKEPCALRLRQIGSKQEPAPMRRRGRE